MEERMRIANRSFGEAQKSAKYTSRSVRRKSHQKNSNNIINGLCFVKRLFSIVFHEKVINILSSAQKIFSAVIRYNKILYFQANYLIIPFKFITIDIFSITKFF